MLVQHQSRGRKYVCKVHIFWEGHKILRNLLLTFDYSTYSQKLGEDFAKFCGLLRIYELYWIVLLERGKLILDSLFGKIGAKVLTSQWMFGIAKYRSS